MQTPTIIAIIIAILVLSIKSISKPIRIIILALLILFTPRVGIYKDGSGSFGLHAIMYDYICEYQGYDIDTKTYSGSTVKTFIFFPYNIIRRFSD